LGRRVDGCGSAERRILHESYIVLMGDGARREDGGAGLSAFDDTTATGLLTAVSAAAVGLVALVVSRLSGRGKRRR
jgi:hypothetical protein